MHKICKCGHTMNMRLRTVIYLNKVEIENVPVFSCDDCNRSEVYPGIKPELTKLIGELGAEPEKMKLPFDERSELAHLVKLAAAKEHANVPLSHLLEGRINELLDLLLLAQSLGDLPWMEDIRVRLTQITKHAMIAEH